MTAADGRNRSRGASAPIVTALPHAQQLRALDSFRALSDIATDALAAHAVTRTFAPGAALFREGTAAHGIFIVLAGEVRVTRTSRGRRHVLHTEQRGGTLGEVPVFDRRPYPVTALATSAVETLHVDRAGLERAFRVSPELAWFFLARVSARVRLLLDRVDGLATAQVSTRLSSYLLEQLARTGDPIIVTTQEALAEELGTVREVVMRVLRALRAQGIIRGAGRGRIEITHPGALRAFASAER